MAIIRKIRTMNGNDSLQINRLPIFRERPHDRVLGSEDLLESEKYLYGYENGTRILPYQMQDLYSRERKTVQMDTIVMENEHLRAEFWPHYGMRLASLWNKDEGRELLFSNPVFQIANLAIRNAWFSGGIEWNIAQLGHTCTTCDDLFVTRINNGEEEFLRIYEYERSKGYYWYIDFHLPDGADYLAAYVRIINIKDMPESFYWWTNIAVPEEKHVRVFSGNAEVIYIDSVSMSAGDTKSMCHGRLPYLEKIEKGVDFTYPENFSRYSNEYFFQNEKSLEESWEAVVYDDGTMFFDRTSENVCFHKMFCWGMHQGGRHWKDFLSEKGKGDYVELQAGFAPTQVHGIIMPERTEWDFVQVFGSSCIQQGIKDGSWEEAKAVVYRNIDSRISKDMMDSLRERYRMDKDICPSVFMNYGHGWGALEEIKTPGCTPSGFYFPKDSIGREEEIWLKALKKGSIEEIPLDELPLSYITDPRWRSIIEKMDENYTSLNLKGVFHLENEEDAKAEEAFRKSIEIKDNAFAHRNLAQLYMYSDKDKALKELRKATSLVFRREYEEEFMKLLVEKEHYKEALERYYSYPEELKKLDRLTLLVLPAAIKLRDFDFLGMLYSREYSNIREGERYFSDAYSVYQAMKDAKEQGIEVTEEMIRNYQKRNEIPYELDFRQK